MATSIAFCVSIFFASALFAQVDNRSHRRIPSPENATNDLLSQFRLMQQLQRMMEERVPVGTMSSENAATGKSSPLQPPRAGRKGNEGGGSGMDELLSEQMPGGIDRRMIQDLMNQLSPSQRKTIEDITKQLQTPEGLPQSTVERLDEQASKLADPQTRQMAQQLLERYRQLQQERTGSVESGEVNGNPASPLPTNPFLDQLEKIAPEQKRIPSKNLQERRSLPGESVQSAGSGNVLPRDLEGSGDGFEGPLASNREPSEQTPNNQAPNQNPLQRSEPRRSGAITPDSPNLSPMPSETKNATNGRSAGGNNGLSQNNAGRSNRYLPEANQAERSQSERPQRVPQQSTSQQRSGEQSSRTSPQQKSERDVVIPDPFAPGEPTTQSAQNAGSTNRMDKGGENRRSSGNQSKSDLGFQSAVPLGSSAERKGQSRETLPDKDAQPPLNASSSNASPKQPPIKSAPRIGADGQAVQEDSASGADLESTIPKVEELLKQSREHPETLPPLALPPRLSENFKRWSEGVKQSQEARAPENQFMDRIRRSLPSDLQSQLRKSGLEQSIREAFQEARQSVVEQSASNSSKQGQGKSPEAIAGGSESKDGSVESASNSDQDWMKKLAQMRSTAESNARSKSSLESTSSSPKVGSSDSASKQTSKQGLVESITSIYKQATGGSNQRESGSKPAPASVPETDSAAWGSTGSRSLTVATLVGLVLAIMLVLLTIALRMNWGDQRTRVQVTSLAPESIVIRDRWDVVRVFHRLATRAGLPVQLWWPHQKAAVAIADSAPWAASEADSLTRIYEKARYLPEQYRLSDAQLAAARVAVERINKTQPDASVRESESGN